MYNDYLYHYGVLGMKWGVRNDRGARHTGSGRKKSTIFSKAKKSASVRRQKKKALNKRVNNIEKMSDKDLDKRIDRVEKEIKLRDLEYKRAGSGKIDRMSKTVGNILGYAGDKSAKAVATGVLTWAGRKVAQHIFGKEVGSDIKVPKK